MKSSLFVKRLNPVLRIAFVLIFLGLRAGMPLSGLDSAQAAPARDLEPAPVMETGVAKIGNPRPLYAIANLLLTKSIDGGATTYEVGDTVYYRIRFQCSSLTTDCGALEITDVLSPNFTYLPSESSVPNGYILGYDSPSHTVTITKDGDNFLDGSQADAVIAVRVNYDMRPLSDTIDNQAIGHVKPPSETEWLPDVVADAPTITIDTVSVDWTLTKTLYSPSIDPTVDTDVTYRLRLCPDTTVGNAELTNVQIIDTLPLHAEFVSASDSGVYTDNVDPTADEVTWDIAGPITPPNCATRYVTIRFNSADGFSNSDTGISNSAEATGDYEGNNGDTCPDCYGSGTETETHDLQGIVEGCITAKAIPVTQSVFMAQGVFCST